MDKETLSNYGWIVIAVLVLAVMIALATPFGDFIANGVKSTTQGMFDTNQKALNSTNLITMDDQSFGSKSYAMLSAPEIVTKADQAVFRSEADIDKFVEVKVDGNVVDEANYTVTEGSTIITFTPGYTKTLENGNHTIEIVSKDGGASCEFTVDIVPELTTLTTKTWNGYREPYYGKYVWTDGTNIYYSGNTKHYVLNGDKWEDKTWKGLTNFYGLTWTDGKNIYYQNTRVLNGDKWEPKTFNGLTYLDSSYIWTDGKNIYCSSRTEHYVLNGDTWEPKTWNGFSKFFGSDIWTDGKNIYCSNNTNQYVLNGDTWEPKTWNGFAKPYAGYIWTDGTYYYLSNDTNQYVLNGDTWEPKTWNGLTSFKANDIWTDGTYYYYSNGSHYVFS